MRQSSNEGLYSFPEDSSAARKRFLETLGRIAPATLERLKEDVYPVYEQCYEKALLLQLSGWGGLRDQADRHALLNSLHQALLDWSSEFNLFEDWLLDAALFTMHRCGTLEKPWTFLYNMRSQNAPQKTNIMRTSLEIIFSFQDCADNEICWLPDRETRKEFEESLDSLWRQEKQKFFEKAEITLKERGAVVVTGKRKIRTSALEHYEMLVHFQVLKLHPLKIAQVFGVESDDTVPKALNATAEDIGLTLREKVKRQYPKPQKRF